ncbi:hypothetical protein HanRHA438_Chr16g0760651 [Helianthus annuus]|nr:hypothetical protein HanRHA438_Chr16g0760651 [Helianthus annuus]
MSSVSTDTDTSSHTGRVSGRDGFWHGTGSVSFIFVSFGSVFLVLIFCFVLIGFFGFVLD